MTLTNTLPIILDKNITDDCKVGINLMSAPNKTLDVGGDINCRGSFYSDSNNMILTTDTGKYIYHNNGNTTHLIVTEGGNTSDVRCKYNKEIYTSSEALNIINRLTVKKYMKIKTIMTNEEEALFESGQDGLINRTDAEKLLIGNPYPEIGLIAQDIDSDLKTLLVTEGSDNEMYKVKYNNIITINTCAIQELNKKIIELELENSKMKNKLNEVLTELGKEQLV